MSTHNCEGASGVGNPYAIFKATYKAETEEVMIDTTFTHSRAVQTAMIQVAQLKDRAILEILPDDVLLNLYTSFNEELCRRNKKRNDEKFGDFKSPYLGSEKK